MGVNLQLQALGLHMLKTVAQRELAEDSRRKDHSFILLLSGELLGNLFLFLDKTLKVAVEHLWTSNIPLAHASLNYLL